ncbi:uncharacterized protein LOC126562745 [Anopheles maculipalpis]|uniref:uncharacterized protein LOC126562745 n=1 Tax=Anopheles maculipalpis TaxID=1496333 RepID=UPI002158B32E|nr:uncharacterized protein LOC126562745 [Anopheles maculipalpis]
MNSLPRLLNPRATSELRRSSAAGLNVVSQRPPLPPKIELRSHSYDGLLDDSASMQSRKAVVEPATTKATEGNDRVDGRGAISPTHQEEAVNEPQIARKVATGTEASIKSKNRRSRSMDDLFDDGDDGTGGDFLDNTQSMETLLEPGSPTSGTGDGCPPETPVRSMGGNICLNRRFVREDTNDDDQDTIDGSAAGSHTASHEQLCEKETITVDSTPRYVREVDSAGPELDGRTKREDDGEDDVLSTHSSVTSSLGSTASGEKGTTGPKKAPKPLINRYVKKVKSFMKM